MAGLEESTRTPAAVDAKASSTGMAAGSGGLRFLFLVVLVFAGILFGILAGSYHEDGFSFVTRGGRGLVRSATGVWQINIHREYCANRKSCLLEYLSSA
jgi:hypothetical protein